MSDTRSRPGRAGTLGASAFSLLCSLGYSQTGVAQHRDVLIAARDGKLVTGTYDWGAGKAELPVRVFQHEFEVAEADFAAASNPGFNAIADPPNGAAPLPEATGLSFRLLAWGSERQANLWRWDGRDPVRFAPVATGESFRFVARDGFKTPPVTGSDHTVQGFTIASTLDGGVLHEHLTLLLLGPDSEDAGTGGRPPAEGVYALAISFSMPDIEASAASWMLMAHGESSSARLPHAAQWVHDHWVPDCSDGLDNDWDGNVDHPHDPDCDSAQSWCETPRCGSLDETLEQLLVDAGPTATNTSAARSPDPRDSSCSSAAGLGSNAPWPGTWLGWTLAGALLVGAGRRCRRRVAMCVLPAVLAALAVASPTRAHDCTAERDFGAGLVDHSCFHTEHGPFVDVTATVGMKPTDATPDVSAVHTHFRVRVTPNEPNLVVYTPNRSGTWVLFGDLEVPQRVFADEGAERQPLMQVEIGGCAALPLARVFELEAATTYHLVLGPADAEQTFVELEKISDFETLYGFDADGDGYGSSSDTLLTPCLPPDGYVPDATDCDDGDDRVHPGAAERCDEVDRNCNGSPTDGFDVGETCSVGTGACEVTGSVVCVDGGESAWCPVEPRAPTKESCNGLDDDCDGVPDEDEQLCKDEPSGRRCVTLDGDSYCGCRADDDCAADRLCDPRSGRCVASDAAGCGCIGVGSAGAAGSGIHLGWYLVSALLLLGRIRLRSRSGALAR